MIPLECATGQREWGQEGRGRRAGPPCRRGPGWQHEGGTRDAEDCREAPRRREDSDSDTGKMVGESEETASFTKRWWRDGEQEDRAA